MFEVVAFIIARNEEDSIDRTLNSLLDQTYPLKEIVVINDGSTDKTRLICEFCQEASDLIKIVDLPPHEESYVGKWQLARSINQGLKVIKKAGVPDFILQVGGDHFLPFNYVSELVDRMTDKIRISSGTYEGAKLNLNTPLGSGKLIDSKLWNKFNEMLYPEKYGYESWIDYRFRKEGFEVTRYDDLITECRPIRMNKQKAFSWGRCTYAQGGRLPFAILKALQMKASGFSFMKGYFSRKDVETHEDIFDYVGSMQYQKLKFTLKKRISEEE